MSEPAAGSTRDGGRPGAFATTRGPSPVLDSTRQTSLPDRIAVFALGFSLQFNVLTSTFGLSFMRLSDLVPFALIPYFCLRTDFVSRALQSYIRIGIVLGLLSLSVVLKADKGPGDAYMTLITMVYFVQALQILTVFSEELIAVLCGGIFAGYFASLAVLVAAGAGLELEAYGLAVPVDDAETSMMALFMKEKLGGLWAAGNQTGHIFAAAGAAALCLTLRFRAQAFYYLYILGLIVSFPLTNNRSGMIVPLLATAFVVHRHLKPWQVVAVGAVIGCLAVYIAVTGTYPLPESLANALESRLYADNNIDNNVTERFDSGFGAIGLMLSDPFGLGNVATGDALEAITGISTPHNGIIALGFQSGTLVSLIYLVSLVQIFVERSRTYGTFVFMTCLFSTPSMFFEQLTATQYFLFIIAIVLAAWAVRGTRPIPPRSGPGRDARPGSGPAPGPAGSFEVRT